MGSISEFIERHFRHFNAAVLKDAADAYIAHLDRGGKMMITAGGRDEHRRTGRVARRNDPP
jgi:hypothetical protein